MAKGNRTAAEFGYPQVEEQSKATLRDAAAVNATRYALVRELKKLEIPIGSWSGGRTRWNRARFGLSKTHALDALCVGDLAEVEAAGLKTATITAMGRGRYGRTLLNECGFPRGYLMRNKRVHGIQTGDLVLAKVPDSLKARGDHKGRIAVRASGSFRMGKVDSIPASCCRVLQRADGYHFAVG